MFALDMIRVLERKSFSPPGPFSMQGSQQQLLLIEENSLVGGVLVCCCCLVAKSRLTDCDPVDCSPSGSSIHGSLQARILGWVAMGLLECRDDE